MYNKKDIFEKRGNERSSMKKKSPIKRKIIISIETVFFLALICWAFQLSSIIKNAQQGRAAYRYSEELEAKYFPFDEKESKKIDNSQPYNEGETWAIYMYLNASNLELEGHSQLSEFVERVAKDESGKRVDAEKEYSRKLFTDFIETTGKNNIPMPISFYDAHAAKEDKQVVPEEQKSISNTAWGSEILDAIKKGNYPDNVTIVIQPGGAKAWKDAQVNPNRTRRFLKKGNELVEVYDAPVSNMGKSETLTDFLKFCKSNYPADHTMLILSDHGGAMTGFGWDKVYDDDNLTLKELTEAFNNAYEVNEENPPIDLLYFNACLMANTDVINAMRGVCKYMVAGEEVGLAYAKYYTNLADRMSAKPNMNAMQLGKAIIDSYTTDLVKGGALIGAPQPTGLGLIDMQKAIKVYEAYAKLANHILRDVADNPKILARLSRSISESISFAVEYYKGYNLTDLGLWVQNMKDLYPEESKEIVDLLDQSVLYKRLDSYLKDAQGISVYFPNYVEDLAALNVALKYVDSISYSEDISTLYYYKLAGCLNEKYTEYCKANGIKVPKPIDYNAMSVLRHSEITPIDDMGNVKATIDESVYPILMDVRYELAKVDGERVDIYGEDRFVASDGGKGIQTEFKGKWLNIGEVPFYVKVINTYENVFIYESPVKYKGFEYRLIIRCEVGKNNGEDVFTILGLRDPKSEAATIDRNVTAIAPGSYIIPIYYESLVNGEVLTAQEGISVLYNKNTVIEDRKLEKGKYRVRIVYENMRGEDVYSAPIFFDVK